MSSLYSTAPKLLFSSKLPILKTIVFFGPLAIIAVFAIVYADFPSWYLPLVEEDGISEYTQAGAYFLAAAIGIATAVRLRELEPKGIYWLLIMFALGTLFMGCEEINWGQRLIGFYTPEFIKVENTQSELSIHNLKLVEKHMMPRILIAVGLYGGLAWVFQSRTSKLSSIIIPDWYCSLYFLSVAAFNVYRWYIRGDTGYLIHQQIGFWRHQELFELLLAIGFLLVAIRNYKNLTSLKH